MTKPRVVITGIGAISPLGNSVKQLWEGLLAGKSGIRRITQFDPKDLPCQIAGEIPEFNPEDFIERKEARRIARSSQIALAAAIEAVNDAKLPQTMIDPERSSVVFGTGIGGFDVYDQNLTIFRTQGVHRVNPFALPASIPNLPAFIIGRQFQCLGPSITLTTACATSTQAVGEAMELIRRGIVDVVITGGTEALITDFSIGGFIAMRALPIHYNDRPGQASRPFEAKREGFVFSEGAGVLILERLDFAQKRGAPIHAEVLGHASSSDGYHIAAPDPQAAGPARAIRWALEDAGVIPDQVDYINAHGTSTPLNDLTETRAIKTILQEHAYHTMVSSIKSMLGHAMGASGALAAISTTLTVEHGWVPPTINYEEPDPECDLDYVPNQARQANVVVALSNSFGLGGQNSCIVLKHYQNNR
jgi:beta-ketoacyl-acyl-carrier-protein synthase II